MTRYRAREMQEMQREESEEELEMVVQEEGKKVERLN